MRLGWVHYSIGAQSGVEMVMRRFAEGLLGADPGLAVHFVGRTGAFAADWLALAPGRVSATDLPEMALGTWTGTAPESRAKLVEKLAADLSRELAGCEAVILGCTEIGLLLQQEHSPLPLFDTAHIHAEAAARLALAS